MSQPTLAIERVQPCLGRFGPVRDSNEYFPFDVVFVRYVVTGIRPDPEGIAAVETTISILDGDGRVLTTNVEVVEGQIALGGATLPGTAQAELDGGVTPGRYAMSVAVRDKGTGRTASFLCEFSVKPETLALVAPVASYDPEGQIAAPFGGLVGQTVHFRLKLIGFDRRAGRIDSGMTIQVLDDERRAMLPVPPRQDVVQLDPEIVRSAEFLVFAGAILLNRAGRFTLVVEAEDRVAGRSTRFAVPLIASDVSEA